MSLFARVLQPVVSAGWYAAHPKKALNLLKKQVLTLKDGDGWEGFTGGPTYTGKPVSDTTLLQITATWSAIRLISETIGTLPLNLYKRTDTGRILARDHHLFRLLHTQPNPYMTSVEWREAMGVSLCVWGHAYNKKEVLGKRIASLVPIAKPLVNAKVENGVPVFTVTENGKQKDYSYGELVSIKGFGGAGELEGYPPYKLHRQSIAVTAAAEEFAARFFGNGARPSGLLMYDKVLQKEQRESLRQAFEMIHSGLENSNRLAVLEAGMTYQPITSSASEAQLIEARRFQIAEAARIWRVPLNMLMETGDATYSNTEQHNLHFLTYTLMPYLRRIEQSLNTSLLSIPEQRRYYIEFDVRGLLRGDSKARSEYYRNMRMIGGMSINDIRELENLPTVEGGDDLHVPLNMGPVDQLREILGDTGNAKPD